MSDNGNDKAKLPDFIDLPAATEQPAEVEMRDLFRIGETMYQIPAKPKVNVALRYLKNVRERGEDLAAAELMVEMLGEDGFNALAEYDDLTTEQFENIQQLLQKHVLGAMEKNRGNSSRGQRR